MFGYKKYGAGKRYGGYSSARGYRTYYGKKFGSTTLGKAVGNAKAQRAGVKNNYFSTTVENVGVSVSFAANAENSGVYSITPMHCLSADAFKNNLTPVARSSPLLDKQFRAMCHMYDQIKIIGMKVSIQVTPCGANASAIVAPCTIGTLWNRNTSAAEVSSLQVSDIESCGSTQVSSLGGYSRYTIKRSIYCRDLQEKANWFDTNIRYNNGVGESPVDWMVFQTWDFTGQATSPQTRSLPYFCPTLYFYLKRGITTPAETWYMTVRCTYMCVFRNTINRLDSFCTLNGPGYVNPSSAKSLDYSSKGLPTPDKYTLTYSSRDPMPPTATITEVEDDEDDKIEQMTLAVKEEAHEDTEMNDDPGTA